MIFNFPVFSFFPHSCRYLIEQGADVASVNNDGELAVDIAESDEMEDLLHAVLKERGLHFTYEFLMKLWFGPRTIRIGALCPLSVQASPHLQGDN